MFAGQGQVAQVSAKPFTDKWGKNITLYSFQLNGDNSWYRTGTNPPPCEQGQMITFTFEQQGNNKKVDINSIQAGQGAPVAQAPQAVQPAVAPSRRASGGANSRDDYWANKETYDKEVTQPRISYAAAQKSAVAIVTTALANDVIGFGNAKKADKMEMLLEYVDEITGRLALRLNSGHEILSDLKNNTVVPEQVIDEDAMYAEG